MKPQLYSNHRDKSTEQENVVNIVIVSLYMAGGNYTYWGEHLVMHIIVQSLWCTPEPI